jgi:oligosaccharyltransferase complex subunit delta (ribophorin II)
MRASKQQHHVVPVQAFPSGLGGVYTLLFHGSIAAMLVLYLAFWTHLNLMQTLPIAAVIGVLIMGTGYKSLSAVAEARIEESKKKKE